MNFLITENEKKLDFNEEVVVIKLDRNKQTEKVYFHFPSNRFVNQKEKLITFLNKVKGTIDEEDGGIYTKYNSYEIYNAFYNIFY